MCPQDSSPALACVDAAPEMEYVGFSPRARSEGTQPVRAPGLVLSEQNSPFGGQRYVAVLANGGTRAFGHLVSLGCRSLAYHYRQPGRYLGVSSRPEH